MLNVDSSSFVSFNSAVAVSNVNSGGKMLHCICDKDQRYIHCTSQHRILSVVAQRGNSPVINTINIALNTFYIL